MTQNLSAAQLELLERRRGERRRRQRSTIPRREVETGPLSDAQERLWFFHQLAPASALYNVYGALRLSGPLSVPLLSAAIERLHQHHEALRTVVVPTLGPPQQTITASGGPPLVTIDLRALGEEVRDEEARRQAEAFGIEPFDLIRGPLSRVALLPTGDQRSVLCVAMHHLVSDAWSLKIYFRQLSDLYRAAREGRTVELPRSPIRYLDYALWQRQGGQDGEKALEYWRRRLEGAPPETALPFDRPRRKVQRFHGAVKRIRIEAETAEALRTIGRGEQASSFMTLLAALAVLLSRITGQRDLTIGIPVANRSLAEVEHLIGFFVNSLVIRCPIAGDVSFVRVVADVRRSVIEALEHREVAFDRLVHAVQPDRELTRNPLFQVMFDLREGRELALDLPDVLTEPLDIPRRTSKFDWTVTFTDAATTDGLDCELEYNSDLFDPATIERTLGHLHQLFATLARHPLSSVAEHSLLTPGEHQRIVVEWNRTARPYPRETAVHRLFERQVEARADALAAIHCGQGSTYDQLNRQANRLARHLVDRGLRPGGRAAFRLPASGDVVVAMLAILKAGGTYVPLDPQYPEKRLMLMYADAEAQVLLTTRELAASFSVPNQVLLDEHPAAWEENHSHDLRIDVPADASAYLIYTSGSTGQPKAVEIPHRAIARLVLGTDYVQIRPGDRVAQLSSSSFDAATFEIWGPLLCGGTVVGIDREVSQLPDRFARQVREMEIHTVFLTTALFNIVAREEPTAFATLREVLFGGEACDPKAAASVLDNGPPGRLLHVYGPTESTTFTTWHEVDDVPRGAHTLPIGKPIANTRVYVIDRGLQAVPVGVAGELWITGDGLARGYAGRPALTAERFVPDPHSPDPGGRAYRTGDLVRYRGGGAIEFLGRLDQQLKIRGFRIEPGEIESALVALEDIEECFVESRRLPSGDQTLVAYVVASPAGFDAARTASVLEESVPRYMVPSFFVLLDELPLNSNGKVDRSALPPPDFHVAAAGDASALPRTPVEREIATIWEEVLQQPRVSVFANFFGLGGHSLLATQVITRIRDRFSIDLPIQAIFDRPTVSGLAEKVEAMRGDQAGSAGVADSMEGEQVEVLDDGSLLAFPSSLQRRTWELEIAVRGSFVNHMEISYTLVGELDVAALQASFREVVRRHQSLRCAFPEVAGEPRLRIYPDLDLAQSVVDLSSLPPEAAERATVALALAEFRRPFDIFGGPLVRSIVLRMSPTRHVWLRPMHHIIYDGWSEGVMLRDLLPIYEALAARMPLPELPPAGRFTDYVAWQRRCLEGKTRERLIAYWVRYLEGCSFDLELPTDRPKPAVARYDGGDERRTLSRQTTDALKALGAEEDASLFMVLFAGLQVLLHSYTGQLETVLSTPVANRHLREFEDAIGLFVSDILLRTDLSGDPTFRALVHQVRRSAIDGYRHQDLPYEVIEEALQPDRHNPLPLFRAQFLHQNMPMPELVMHGVRLEPFSYQGIMAPFDLTTEVTERGGCVILRFNFKLDVFERATVSAMLDRYATLLEAIVDDPDRALSQLVALT
jgi:amino acid adenylation domain-containing protein